MRFTPIQLKKARAMMEQMSEMIERQSHCCAIMADPVRIKILVLLKQYHELCLAEISDIMLLNKPVIANQLKKLINFGSVQKNPSEHGVCYTLNKKNHVVYCLYNFQKQRI